MNKKNFFVVILLINFIFMLQSEMIEAFVYKHVDGDTLYIQIENPPGFLNETEKVRMIGIDTPETVHPQKPVEFFGKEASEYTKSMLLNKTIYIDFDDTYRDYYQRLLVYIYLENGTFFNKQIVKDGYAFAYIKYKFKYKDEFVEAENYAKENKLGLWK
jgi:micrococcal nuclease